MFMHTANKILRTFGYKIVNDNDLSAYMGSSTGESGDYVLHSYLKNDGSFDYDNYKKIQEEGNKRKIDSVWVLEKNIKFLSDYIKDIVTPISLGLCHGTRRGKEQEWFKKYINDGVQVIGTELSETATDFKDTIQWDFHEVKPEWIDSVDFIYSNSFDHSYDPEKCLNAWMKCVRPGGVCILEHTDAHSPKGVNELDPFGAHLMQMPLLVAKWGAGKYSVREIIKAPTKGGNVDYVAFIIIQRH